MGQHAAQVVGVDIPERSKVTNLGQSGIQVDARQKHLGRNITDLCFQGYQQREKRNTAGEGKTSECQN